VGYTSRVGLAKSTDIKEILDDTPYEKWPLLLIKVDKNISFRMSSSSQPSLVKRWPEDAMEIIEYAQDAPVIVKLTDDYNAIVNPNEQTVSVGCQTIPFYRIEELYKAMHTDA
jgi:hypothetical protein